MDAEHAYLFRHVLVREAAYQLFPPDTKAGLHALALDVVTVLYQEDEKLLRPLAAELAHHAHIAQSRGKRYQDWLHKLRLWAASFAGEQCRPHEAATHLQAALDLPWLDDKQRHEIAVSCGKHLLNASALPALRVLLDDALPRAREHGLPRAVLLLYEADFLYLTGKVELADAAYREAAQVAGAEGNEEALANILCNAAIQRCDEWKFEEALDGFRAAHAINLRIGNSRGSALTSTNIAYALQRLDRAEEAMAAYEEGLALTARLGLTPQHANGLSMRALLFRRQGREAEALESYRKAIAVLEPLGERFYLSQALGSAAMLLVDAGRYAESEQLARRGHEYAREGSNAYTAGMSLVVLATALRGQHRWDEALQAAKAAAVSVTPQAHAAFVVQANLALVECAIQACDFETAYAAQSRIAELVAKVNNPMLALMLTVATARIDLAEGRFEEVIAAAAALPADDDDETSADVLLLAVRACIAQGQPRQAQEWADKVAALAQRCHGLDRAGALSKLETANRLIRAHAQGVETRHGTREDEASPQLWARMA